MQIEDAPCAAASLTIWAITEAIVYGNRLAIPVRMPSPQCFWRLLNADDAQHILPTPCRLLTSCQRLRSHGQYLGADFWNNAEGEFRRAVDSASDD
jgi:hypothetical protein